MNWIPWTLAALLGLAGGVGVWYYRQMWTTTRKALSTARESEVRWAAQNELQARRLAEATEALKARHEKETRNDEAVADGTVGDAGRVADLLNQLHQGGPGGRPGDAPSVRSGSGTPIPEGGSKAVR